MFKKARRKVAGARALKCLVAVRVGRLRVLPPAGAEVPAEARVVLCRGSKVRRSPRAVGSFSSSLRPPGRTPPPPPLNP